MNIVEILVVAALIVAVAAVIAVMIRNKKKGKSCSCNCEGCLTPCQNKEKKRKEPSD